MPTYTHSIGGKTYTFDSPTPLSPEEQRQEATIFYMEDKADEREHLANSAAFPTKDEEKWNRRGQSDPESSVWKGVEEGATDFVNGVANTVAHPLNAAKNMWDAQVHQGELATDARKKGNYMESFGRDLLAAVPVLGPAAANVGEDITKGVVDRDSTALGRGGFNASLLFGPGAAKSVYENAGSISELGRGFAKNNPGLMRTLAGAGEGYALHGGKGAAVGGVLGAVGAPTRLSDLKALIKDVTKKGGEEAGETAGAESAAAEAAEAAPATVTPKPTQRATPRPKNDFISDPMNDPEIQKILDEQHQEHLRKLPNGGAGIPGIKPLASHPTKAAAPDFLKQDVAGWKPGASFDPKTKSLSVPGKGSQATKLLRGDESVMGLARELGLDVPPEGFSEYPTPTGSSPAATALRQRASISGQRSRTRPRQTTQRNLPLSGKEK